MTWNELIYWNQSPHVKEYYEEQRCPESRLCPEEFRTERGEIKAIRHGVKIYEMYTTKAYQSKNIQNSVISKADKYTRKFRSLNRA